MGATSLAVVDFLGIGAQRSATTWLHENLRHHPQMWLPPLKELHYFDNSTGFPSASHVACETLWRGLVGRRQHELEWRRSLISSVSRVIRRQGLSTADMPWLFRYHLRFPKHDDWYRALFAAGEGRIKGEITPAYCLLNEPTIAHIASLFPELRIVFIIRDPLARALSQMALHRTAGALPRRMSPRAMMDFLSSPMVTARGDYLDIVRRWRKYIPADRFLIAWYDDVVAQPDQTLHEVARFLGASPPPYAKPHRTDCRVNASGPWHVPPEVVPALAQHLRPQMVQLADALGGHARQWLAHCDDILSRSRN